MKISNRVNKKTIEGLKLKLLESRKKIEKELERFAQKDKGLQGDWDTRFPKFSRGTAGSSALEEAADEVEEYSALLPIEHNLELRLKDINSALDKIKKGLYGLCGKCGKPVAIKRLEVYPEAKFCLNCEK